MGYKLRNNHEWSVTEAIRKAQQSYLKITTTVKILIRTLTRGSKHVYMCLNVCAPKRQIKAY